ncbi:MAG: hypothetical protein NUV69_01585 [Candidatus Curtissbacteria bacterium]|nr:hypothetical protein [Candidatus Curtissbacteria bacterium]
MTEAGKFDVEGEFSRRIEEESTRVNLYQQQLVGRLESTFLWVNAMRNLHVPTENILKIWDEKDQNSRELKERSDPQAPTA